MTSAAREYYFFDEFRLDLLKRRLERDGEAIPLKPKAFDLLLVLVENSGQLMSKDDLFQLVWSDRIVEESNLSVHMAQIRKALGESAKQPRYILTVSGEGYRFVGNVHTNADPECEEIFEQQTFASIVLESDVVDERPVQTENNRRWANGRPLAVIFGLLVIFLLTIFGGFLVQDRFAAKTQIPFQRFSIKRLTNNGKVTYASLSPDGKLFAYSKEHKDGRASLWLGHVNGTSEVQLREPAEVTYAFIKFAPDGSTLYYVAIDLNRASALFKMPVLGGKADKIKDEINFISFAPSGEEFVFVRNEADRSALKIADLRGNERELISRPRSLEFNARTPAWSPDGKMIAVAAFAKENAETQEILIVTVDDGSISRLTDLGWQLYRSLVWRNDANGLIAVGSERSLTVSSRLWHISYPTGEARPILSDLNAYGQLLDLSADDTSLLAVQAQHQSNVWIAPANDLAAAEQITFDSLGTTNGWYGVDWLPGRRLVYTSFVDGNTGLWTMAADGSGPVQLTSGANDFHISSSEVCGCVVFESDRGASKQIWSVNFDGSDLRQVTNSGKNVQPHISPDGQWITFASTRGDSHGLWMISTTRGEEILVLDKSVAFPRWSPDGRSIAFHSTRKGAVTIAVVPIDGAGPLREYPTPRLANLNLGVRWTPDGKAITYRDWANGIWRQDIAGGEPQRLAGLPEEKVYAYAWSLSGHEIAFTRGQEIRDVVLLSMEK